VHQDSLFEAIVCFRYVVTRDERRLMVQRARALLQMVLEKIFIVDLVNDVINFEEFKLLLQLAYLLLLLLFHR
jgi:hypothetical protein